MSVQSVVIATIRVVIKTVEMFSLKKATDIANHLWLRPLKHPRKPADQARHESATRFHVDVRGVQYEVESWGSGPVVLMIHGWDGRASQMYALVPALLNAGFRVVTFDMPASGSAPGDQVDPKLAGEMVQAVAASVNGVEALVTHSFGSTWGLVGVVAGRIPVQKVVLISPPFSLRKIFEKFCRRLSVSKRLRASLEKRFVEIHGNLWTNYSNDALVTRLGECQSLVIHDEGDKEVPFAEGQALAQQWPGATFIGTRGLGHYRVLRDEAVIAHTVNFLSRRTQGADDTVRLAQAA